MHEIEFIAWPPKLRDLDLAKILDSTLNATQHEVKRTLNTRSIYLDLDQLALDWVSISKNRNRI